LTVTLAMATTITTITIIIDNYTKMKAGSVSANSFGLRTWIIVTRAARQWQV
jgi:phage head maturation protease